jgi:Tol biopolymer transport system component
MEHGRPSWLTLGAALLLVGTVARAQTPTVTPTADATTLVNAILGPGVTLVPGSAVFVGGSIAPSLSAGTFANGGLAPAGIGIASGILLTTGEAAGAIAPNDNTEETTDLGLPGDDELSALAGYDTSDATVLRFSFTTTVQSDISFRFVFASEEYPEYVNTEFNDVFAFYLDGENLALVPGTASPVSINSINGQTNAAYYRDNADAAIQIQYDGLTTVLTARRLNLPPGTHVMKLAIADASDSIVDSAVFIEGTSFQANYTLTTNKAGTGTGTVTSSPPGINCGDTCSASFASGTAVTLTATPAAGSTFGGWSGDADCGDGAVTLTAARTCTATFTVTTAPAITTVTPATGPLAGGTAIVISGSGFTAGAGVTVGGIAAANVTVVNATTITAATPAATVAGARNVVVTGSGGDATRPGGFTYVADVVTDETRGDAGRPVPPGTDFLQPAISGDGRYLTYVVTSDGLITGDTNGVPDVVVRDRVSGQVVRVSVGSDGAQANGPSGRPRISANGRYVAFWSEASTLVAGDTNGVRDVFLHDRDADGNGVFDETGVGARSTTRVSVATSGAEGNAASALDGDTLVAGVASDGQHDLSPDGLWVAFRSAASNLVPGDTNGMADIFLRSVAGQQTTRVSMAQDGTQADGASQSPGVSAGAQRIVFASRATNLVAGTADANDVPDVFVVERASGQVVRLSEPASGVDADGASDAPAIDDAGRIVVFATLARNLLPALATSTTSQIVVTSLPASTNAAQSAPALPGAVFAPVIPVTEILKQLASGVLPPGTATVEPGNGASTQPEVCGNGTCTGYVSAATNLTPTDPDTNGTRDALIQPVVPTPPPVPPPPSRVSRDARGNQSTAPTDRVAVGTDGGIVALQSSAALTAEVAASNPGADNVFVVAVPLVLATVSRTSARVDVSETVVFTGAGFQNGATVLFGTVGVAGAMSDAGRTLTAQTPTAGVNPAVVPGVVALTVRNPDGSAVPVFQGFTFLAPPATAPPGDADADGLPDAWETAVGLNPFSAAGAEGASGDPDADGQTNAQEFAQQTHPRASVTQYLAEAATSTFFTTTMGLANPSATQTAHTWLRFQTSAGAQVTWGVAIPPLESRTVVVNTIAGLETAEFSTVVESDEPVAVHRLMTWDAVRGYGSHLEAAVLAPAPRWYLAEGSTNAGFQLFYLIQNPGTVDATVEVKFLLPSGSPVVKAYPVSAGSRFNVWVNQIPELASTDCSAVITSTTGVPIIVERAMYLDGPGLPFGAGHESAGVTAPAETWFLAEGATGPYFDLFVLVANPNATAAAIEATYLLPDGTTVVKPYTVAPNARFNIWVDFEDAALANTAVSTLIRVTNGVPVLVERAMWWPGGFGTWHEAHNAFGATQPGTLWALGSGEVTGPPISAATYVLVANTSAWEASVRVSVVFEDGTAAVTRTFAVNATSRFNVDVGVEFPEVLGKRFGVVVESVQTATAGAAQIVVEGARYHNDTADVVWAAGADALATRLR